MRDALSIFDRIVSFSGKNITYRDVIDNLNILDYDYYFRAVDQMLAQDLPSMLLLFDEVLSKGFDAQHFLYGFSDHLRNLMMCKYPNTHKLLEVAQSIAARFMQQSQQCSASLLLNGLNTLNKCELEYKSSKNPRLHVELTLMKLCYIQSLIDLTSDSSDLKKKTNSGSESLSHPISSASESPNPPSVVAQPTPQPTVSTPETPENKAPISVKPFGAPNSISKLERLRQEMGNKPAPNDQTTDAVTVTEVVSVETNLPLTADTLSEAWKSYIQKLTESGKNSLAVIYKNAQYKIKDVALIQLILSSQLELEMIEDDRISITPFLRSTLKNIALDFEYTVDSKVQPFKAFTVEDKFKVMAEKNPTLNDLRQTFGLELE